MRSQDKVSNSHHNPMFINKLNAIIKDVKNEQIISWSSTRDSFIIKNLTQFTQQILPKYFKHRNLASFIRQLNVYGFRKIRHNDGQNVYSHEHFIQGEEHLLSLIAKKSKGEKQGTIALCGRSQGMLGQIEQLRLKQKDLQDMCRQFLAHNQRIIDESQSFVKKLQRDGRTKQRRLQEFLMYLIMQENSRVSNNGQKQLSLENNQPTFLGSYSHNQNDLTPLELLSKNLQKSDYFKQVQKIMQNAYSPNPKRKQNNFTIIPQQTKPQPQVNRDEPNIEEEILSKPISSPCKNFFDEKSDYFSFNDFSNVENDVEFNLQDSM